MEDRKRFRNIAILLGIIIILLGTGIFFTLNKKASSGLVEFVNTRTNLTKKEKPELRTGNNEIIAEKPFKTENEEIIKETTVPEPEIDEIIEIPKAELTTPEPIEKAVDETPSTRTKIERYVVDKHTVQEGESFSLVTGYYWEDIFLWPDLYIRNEMLSDDPDIIFPEETINIFNRLGKKDSYTAHETEEILNAYLEVYKIYKSLGDRKNNSIWTLLYCAAKYDHDFLNIYEEFIDPEDKEMAQKYIDEEGFLE